MSTANHEAFRRWGPATMAVVVEAVKEYDLLAAAKPNYHAAYGYVTSHSLNKAPTEAHFREYAQKLREEGLPKARHTPKMGSLTIVKPTLTDLGRGLKKRMRAQTGGDVHQLRGLDMTLSRSPFAREA